MSARPAVGLLVAAGSGERLGMGTPKALVEVAGVPLVVRSARQLAAASAIDELVVVAGARERSEVEALLGGADVAVRTVVAGGRERHESVACGLAALDAGDGVVAVHDAARPLVSPALVDRVVAALEEPWAAVAPAVPVADTLKVADDEGRVVRTLDRRGVYAVQTPQVFAADTLRRVHARVASAGVTDDLMLVERAGGRVRLIEGQRLNMKLTYREDLAVIEAVLAQGERT